MLKEICLCVEKLEDSSAIALAIGALPEELHAWFTTRVLRVGNGEREVPVSQQELAQLIESAQTWIAVNESKELATPYEVEALEKTLLIIREFALLSNAYVVNFSNYERGTENE